MVCARGLLVLSCVVVLCKGGPIMATVLNEFEEYVESVMGCRQVPGLTITMVKDNSVIYSKGFGYAQVEDKVPVTNDTKFCIGSLTKAFTSTVLAKMLTTHSRFTWDTPIQKILGNGFRLINKLRSENVNLRDLLAHKVGVPGFFNALLVGFPENVTRGEFISYLEYLPAFLPFRTRFVYSNFMYTLAGHVSEKLGGRTWEDLVRDNLFQPLGMDTSGFVTEVSDFDKSFALSYASRNRKPVRLNEKLLHCVDPLGPAGSIYSTANDMGKWMLFHLTAFRNTSLTPLDIDHDILAETYASQMATPFQEKNLFRPKYPIDDVSLAYTLGWVTSVYRGYKRVWHSGGIVGFSSLMWLFPHQNIGIFASLTGSRDNDNQLPIRVIMSRAADMLLGETPWLDSSSACSFPAPWSDVSPSVPVTGMSQFRTFWNSSQPMEFYIGSYGHPAFGNISVTIENQTQLMLYYGRFGRMVLTPVTDLAFKGHYIGPLWFATQADGQVRPVNVNFSFPVSGGIASNLSYPVDNAFAITFQRDFRKHENNGLQGSLQLTCTTSGNTRIQSTLLTFCVVIIMVMS
ncbi:protein flp-like [Ylistrum balloti]|uniref:protein flp-like n=1 Tax=Ylistrum balloti TaxID=509963 RepID=UPI002905AAE0|nr:protein flp-like [Ylistrum balloti]